MYKELVKDLSQNIEWVKIQPPCPLSKISEAEKYVGYSFPKELKALRVLSIRIEKKVNYFYEVTTSD